MATLTSWHCLTFPIPHQSIVWWPPSTLCLLSSGKTWITKIPSLRLLVEMPEGRSGVRDQEGNSWAQGNKGLFPPPPS